MDGSCSAPWLNGPGADNLDQKFSALKMPTLLVWGKQDAITPLSLAEAMHRAASQSVLAVYGGCGHIAVVSCMDRIAPTVLDFLSGTRQQPGQTIEGTRKLSIQYQSAILVRI
jgi:pimeloyl-ACP methyl ester carboxylesterase